MKSQSERDGQTVTVATTLAMFVVVMLVGATVLWLLELVTSASSQAQNTVLVAFLAAAILISGRYLLQHRRP